MDRLGRVRQPEDVQEANHYDTFKTIVEVCKTSGNNFALMRDSSVDMAIEHLYKGGKTSKDGKFKDGTYYSLPKEDKEIAEEMEEEICLSKRFLSLSSNKLHFESKQELKNDKIRGKDKYPRTIAGVLNFLQYHNLRGKATPRNRTQNKGKYIDTMFAHDGEEEDEKDHKDKGGGNQVPSATCKDFDAGTCAYKTKHIWKE